MAFWPIYFIIGWIKVGFLESLLGNGLVLLFLFAPEWLMLRAVRASQRAIELNTWEESVESEIEPDTKDRASTNLEQWKSSNHEFAGTSTSDVEKRMEALEEELARLKDEQADLKNSAQEATTAADRQAPEEKVTFDEMARDLLRDYETSGKRSINPARLSVSHLRAFFGLDRALDITTDKVRAYISRREEEGASTGSINREIAALKRMFSLAVQAGKLSYRPYIPSVEENVGRLTLEQESAKGDDVRQQAADLGTPKAIIIQCHVCGVKNRIPYPPRTGGEYRCGSCKTTIDYRQIRTSTKDTWSDPIKDPVQGLAELEEQEARGYDKQSSAKMVKCQQCGRLSNLEVVELQGATIHCPGCGNSILIPHPTPDTQEYKDDPSQRPKDQDEKGDVIKEALRIFGQYSETYPTLAGYVGQQAIKEDLRVRIGEARRHSLALPHLLLCGSPQMGKKTLAYAIAREMGVNIKCTHASLLERSGDLAALLTTLEHRDVFLIEDIELLREPILEVLAEASKDFHIAITIGEGPRARKITLELKPFTVVGTTTKPEQVDNRLRHWMVVYEFAPRSVVPKG